MDRDNKLEKTIAFTGVLDILSVGKFSIGRLFYLRVKTIEMKCIKTRTNHRSVRTGSFVLSFTTIWMSVRCVRLSGRCMCGEENNGKICVGVHLCAKLLYRVVDTVIV